MPSMPGMTMSAITTQGWNLPARSRASLPSTATSTSYPHVDNSSASQERAGSSSSAMRMRCFISLPPRGRAASMTGGGPPRSALCGTEQMMCPAPGPRRPARTFGNRVSGLRDITRANGRPAETIRHGGKAFPEILTVQTRHTGVSVPTDRKDSGSNIAVAVLHSSSTRSICRGTRLAFIGIRIRRTGAEKLERRSYGQIDL